VITSEVPWRRSRPDAEGHNQRAIVKLTVVGCSPAWPNPGGAQSGYLLEGEQRLLLDCGPGVLARLRERAHWPHVDAIAITHFHLDHWGDLVPWVWGNTFGPGADAAKPELWLPPGGRAVLSQLGDQLGTPEMFEKAFRCNEYAEWVPFTTAGFEVTAVRVPHYDLLSFGFRCTCNGKTLAYSGDTGPSGQLPDLAREADVFLCEATLLAPNPEGGLRGHLAPDEAQEVFEQAHAKRLLLTHRPYERHLDPAFEQAYDGMEVDL
jgi:ribonuclease BN (tRNA processing enzyme)